MEAQYVVAIDTLIRVSTLYYAGALHNNQSAPERRLDYLQNDLVSVPKVAGVTTLVDTCGDGGGWREEMDAVRLEPLVTRVDVGDCECQVSLARIAYIRLLPPSLWVNVLNQFKIVARHTTRLPRDYELGDL